MCKPGGEVRPIYWAVKLLLTMLVSGPFVIGAFFLPANPFPSVTPIGHLGPLCVGSWHFPQPKSSHNRPLLPGDRAGSELDLRPVGDNPGKRLVRR